MIGAIIGDIVGSRFEWNNHRSKDFEFLTYKCFFTDDTVMSLAVCKALMECQTDYCDLSDQAIRNMQEIGRPYPKCGYGGMFYNWMYSDSPEPYNSFGNGAAMRISACGHVAQSIEETKSLSYTVTAVTHNHPEGTKGAEAVAVAVFMARSGKNLLEIRLLMRLGRPIILMRPVKRRYPKRYKPFLNPIHLKMQSEMRFQ